MDDLSPYTIPTLPPSMYYIPSFITPTKEESILLSLPPQKWHNLTHRRLQAHPSILSKNNTLLASPLPAWLTDPIVPRFESLGVFKDTKHKSPNHCLINEYNPGEGIMPHEDGGAYAPVVATVSLKGVVVLDIYAKEDVEVLDEKGGRRPRWRILQESGSLLVTTGEVYESTLHGIADVEVDEDLGPETVANWHLLTEETRRAVVEEDGGRSRRVTRTSLTFRDVLKVSDVGRRILGGRR